MMASHEAPNRVGKSRYALGTNYGLMSIRGLP
jgi:hypothetical protein